MIVFQKNLNLKAEIELLRQEENRERLGDLARQLLSQIKSELTLEFKQSFSIDIELLLCHYSQIIDEVLCALWHNILSPVSENLSLLAAGGYARRELHPFSDIDLLILYNNKMNPPEESALGEFIALLWDIKLIPSHHIYSIDEDITFYCEDLSTLTTLLEARLLTGLPQHLTSLHRKLASCEKWTFQRFFEEKINEKTKRYHKYATAEYTLQPDLKNSPGTLRDIHLLQWIVLKRSGHSDLSELVSQNILTIQEIAELKSCQQLLWRLRYGLHIVCNKKNDRLFFEYQVELAKLLGFKGEPHQQIEQMMRSYFQATTRVMTLQDIALFAWKQQLSASASTVLKIDQDFQLVDHQFIDIINPSYFEEYPEGLIKIFYIMAQHKLPFQATLKTLRLLDRAVQNYHSYLSYLPKARHYFLELLKFPDAIQNVMIKMHDYNILKIYLPAWNKICGLMQFNFFHCHPVDKHSLLTALHAEQIAHNPSYPHCQLFIQIYATLREPSLLFLATLLHDIGKGYGGDHAKIGATIVALFSQQHQLKQHDAELLIWLVEHHLEMSHTAQRLDIQDINVIENFTEQVGNIERLNYLFCLTVADICATHPSLWNDWRHSMLSELYRNAVIVLTNNHAKSGSRTQYIQQQQQTVLALSQLTKQQQQRLLALWKTCPMEYFLGHNVTQLLWHSRVFIETSQQPQVLIMHNEQRGAMELFIYTKDRSSLFAIICDCLHRKNLSIVAAQIFTTSERKALDTFSILQPNGQTVSENRYQDIQHALQHALQQASYQFLPYPKPTPLPYFNIKTHAKFTPVMRYNRTQLALTTYDRFGLLAQLAQFFARLKINLHDARIATVGQQVNDVFLLSYQNDMLTHEQQSIILQWIYSELA